MNKTPFWEDMENSKWQIAWSERINAQTIVRCIARATETGSESKIVLDHEKDGYIVYNYNPEGLK